MKKPQMISDTEDTTDIPSVSNSFIFTEDIYKYIFPYSPGNALNQIFRAWGKWALLTAALGTPIAVLLLAFFFSMDPSVPRNYYALIPTISVVVLIIIGVGWVRQWNHINWDRKMYRQMLEADFSRLQGGCPLVFNVETAALGSKLFKKDNSDYQSFPLAYRPSESYEFNACIRDDGIYIGRSNKRVVSNFTQDITDIYQSGSYWGIEYRGQGNIIFEKRAFKGSDFKRIEAFIKAKKKGKDVLLVDYMDKQEG